ncbi:MAG: hypothetical protein FJ404_11965 [Verrucomicrobia bacterium]|nr:hypothetical protein [Verrucomicrobiota bacterium]
MLPVMQVGRVRPGASPEHDVLHPVGGGLGQARPTNNIGMYGFAPGASASCRGAPFTALPPAPTCRGDLLPLHGPPWANAFALAAPLPGEAAMPR